MSAWGEPGRGYPRSRKAYTTADNLGAIACLLLIVAVAVLGVIVILQAGGLV